MYEGDAHLTAAIYGANFHDTKDKGHWIEVMASIFKMQGTADAERGKTLVKILCLGQSE